MDPTILLDRPSVSLAGDQLVVDGSQYTVAEIRSARVMRMPKAATGPILMIAVGVICFLSVAGEAGLVGAVLGAALLVGAIAWWKMKKPSYQVILATPTGDETPFESPDEDAAKRVLAAVERARAGAGREA